MEFFQDISNMIQNLKKELEDLPIFLESMKLNNKFDLVQLLTLEDSFNTLYQKLHFQLKRFQRLSKLPSLPQAQFISLKFDYEQIIKSVIEFYNSSRILIPTLTPDHDELFKPVKGELKEKEINMNYVTEKAKSFVKLLKNHSHKELESCLDTLENSTSSLKNKSIFLLDEVRDNLNAGKSLLCRLKKLEKSK